MTTKDSIFYDQRPSCLWAILEIATELIPTKSLT